MLKHTLMIVSFALLCCVGCFGQSSYKGLTPGRSTRADVERALGEPAGKVSETLVEYAPQSLTGKIFVQYRAGTTVVERIEFLCRTEYSTCDDLVSSLRLRLPDAPDGDRSEGERWKYLYGAPLYVVTSGPAADEGGDRPTPTRVALYSRELFEADIARAKEAGRATAAGAEEAAETSTSASGGAESRTGTITVRPAPIEVNGVVKVRSADGSERRVAGATVEFYRTDRPGYFQTDTDDYGVFSYFGPSLEGTWVIVASGRGMKWAFLDGVQPPAYSLEIVAERGDGARPTREQVMAAIR